MATEKPSRIHTTNSSFRQAKDLPIKVGMIALKVANRDMPSLLKTRRGLWIEYKKAATSTEQRRPYADLKRYRFLRALYSKNGMVRSAEFTPLQIQVCDCEQNQRSMAKD